MKRIVKIAAAIVVSALLLALLSYATSRFVWDGGFPSGEIRINVRDTEGRPIKGATLRIYRGGTRQPAFGYPIANHTSASGLVSDESGQITAVQERGGTQFGGRSWKLFWIIPMEKWNRPQFDCEITASGYHAAEFEVGRLFKSPYTMYEQFPKTKRVVNGKEVELPVYDQAVTLCR